MARKKKNWTMAEAVAWLRELDVEEAIDFVKTNYGDCFDWPYEVKVVDKKEYDNGDTSSSLVSASPPRESRSRVCLSCTVALIAADTVPPHLTRKGFRVYNELATGWSDILAASIENANPALSQGKLGL